MSEPMTYEIVLRGRASARLLRPLLDDFILDAAGEGVTRLVGDIGDASHLHGVIAHLTSVNVEVIAIAPLGHIAGVMPRIPLPDPPDPTHGAQT